MIRRHPGEALVIAVFVAIWGLITHGTFAGSGDEPHYLLISHSLAFDRDLDLANDYRDASLITANNLEPGLHARVRDGRLRPVHDIGLPLLFAPAIRLAYPAAEGLGRALPPALLRATRLNEGLLLRHQVSLMMALLAGLLAREIFLLFCDLSGATRHAFRWTLLFILSPPILSHAFLFFPEIPTALLGTIVFRRLSVRPVQQPAAAAFVGALAGMLLLLHARNIGLVAGLVVLAALGLRRRTIPMGACAAFLAGVSAGLAARTVITYILWDTFITTPHAAPGVGVSMPVMAHEMFVRLTGLLFDREHGLIAYAPLYVLAVAGLFLAADRRPRLSRDLFLLLATYLIPILLPQINVHGWRGGWSPAARFLVPVAPLLCVAAYVYVLAGARRLLLVLAAIQLGINAYVWQFPKTLWNEGDGTTAFALARWLPSWADPTPAQHVLFLAALCGTFVFGYVSSRLVTRSDPQKDPSTAT